MPYNSPLDSLSYDRIGGLLLKANILIFVHPHPSSPNHLTWFLFLCSSVNVTIFVVDGVGGIWSYPYIQLVHVASYVKWIPSHIIIIVITWFICALYLITQPSINDSQPLAVIIGPRFAQADNDCLRLLIIDVGLLIKYNALTNHVIVIISGKLIYLIMYMVLTWCIIR